jgi:Trk K+ transport system NAD-binding subunit
VLCGYGRLGHELAADLRAEGLEVTVVEQRSTAEREGDVVTGDATDPWVMAQADLDDAVGFVAGTDNDTTNLSLVAAARRSRPELFVCARQNHAASAPLFAAMDIDALLVPAEVVAHEVYAQLSTPLLWRFLREMPAMGETWAAELVDRLTALSGSHLQELWKVRLTQEEAPAVTGRLASGEIRLGDLLRDPEDREHAVHALVLLVLRDGRTTLAPDEDFVLADGDELLLAGKTRARRALDTVLLVDGVLEYVVSGRRVPEGWVWRKLTGTGS